MAEQNYSLLIAALVAVVAIVGLVLFASGQSGAVVYTSSLKTPIIRGEQAGIGGVPFYAWGKVEGNVCATQETKERSQAEVTRCCNDRCTTRCEDQEGYKVSGRTVDDCFRNCRSGCKAVVDSATQVG